jgi:hypothetical protein
VTDPTLPAALVVEGLDGAAEISLVTFQHQGNQSTTIKGRISYLFSIH